MTTLEVENKRVKFEVNSGAAVTVMSKYEAARLFPGTTIHHTNLQLISYCNRTLRSVGFIKVRVKFNSVTREPNIYLVNGERKPLLGREWIRQLSNETGFLLNNASLNAVAVSSKSKLKFLIEKFKKTCTSKLSAITGIQAALTLKQEATPVFIRARSVPFKLLPLVEQELNKLESAGTIEEVTTSRWTTPIIPILKRDGSVRICSDYKVTVNPHLIIDNHPLPTTDELFVKLAHGKKFSKIDLKQAYLQLEIAPEYREILTLSTCKGLYKVNRLMYGIAPGPAIWQREIENILQDIEGVAIFIDDIIVTGESDEIHLSRLEEVLHRLHRHNIQLN